MHPKLKSLRWTNSTAHFFSNLYLTLRTEGEESFDQSQHLWRSFWQSGFFFSSVQYNLCRDQVIFSMLVSTPSFPCGDVFRHNEIKQTKMTTGFWWKFAKIQMTIAFVPHDLITYDIWSQLRAVFRTKIASSAPCIFSCTLVKALFSSHCVIGRFTFVPPPQEKQTAAAANSPRFPHCIGKVNT